VLVKETSITGRLKTYLPRKVRAVQEGKALVQPLDNEEVLSKEGTL